MLRDPQLQLDSRLQSAVLDALAVDDSLAPAEIAVGVREGVVSLTGEVDSLVRRTRAARAVEGVPGMRSVANDITVRLNHDQRRTDTDIALDAVNALVADDTVPDKTIKPRVQDGWIWLIGEADDERQRRAAERAVEDIMGSRV
ncbi:MAG TPA: BON domain-containing protein [Gemmatimonadaceae bacterium]